MKKLTTLSAVLLIFIFSCQKSDQSANVNEELPNITERYCASHEILEQQLAADPARRQRLQEIEEFTSRYIQNMDMNANRSAAVTIPVVVHVVWKTSAQRISEAQVQSQIAVLNEDFQQLNADNSNVPSHFSIANGNPQISFTLDQIIYVQTKKSSFGTNDDIKRTARGGSNPVDPANKLNLWSGNLSRGLLGYAQFPGGPLATDGVVILYSAVGSRDKYPGGTYVSNYDLGRTATHEVGHYLNLRHIWGDATCGNDYSNDTPQHNTSNCGCPASNHRSTRSGATVAG